VAIAEVCHERRGDGQRGSDPLPAEFTKTAAKSGNPVASSRPSLTAPKWVVDTVVFAGDPWESGTATLESVGAMHHLS
jgi:hypothetical protein